jgi:putative transposase
MRIRDPLAIPSAANDTWSADFMADALWSGRRFRTFNVNDDFNRESLRIEIDTSLPALLVIRALDELVEVRGAPRRLRLDNGPEFISAALKLWAQRHGVELLHIQPGKPTQRPLRATKPEPIPRENAGNGLWFESGETSWWWMQSHAKPSLHR